MLGHIHSYPGPHASQGPRVGHPWNFPFPPSARSLRLSSGPNKQKNPSREIYIKVMNTTQNIIIRILHLKALKGKRKNGKEVDATYLSSSWKTDFVLLFSGISHTGSFSYERALGFDLEQPRFPSQLGWLWTWPPEEAIYLTSVSTSVH